MQILSKVEQVKYLYKMKLKINQGGFPGGSVVESLPASEETRVPSLTLEVLTCFGATGSLHTTIKPVPWSLEATTTEPMDCNCWSLCALQPVLCNKRSHKEKPTTTTRQKPAQQCRPAKLKMKKNKLNYKK